MPTDPILVDSALAASLYDEGILLAFSDIPETVSLTIT